MKDLNNNIIQWTESKGILDNATPLTQLKKTFEELAELINALIDKDHSEIKDAIGDVNVTLIILNKLSQLKESETDLAGSNIFLASNWIVEIFQKVANKKDISLDIIRAQDVLHKVAKEHSLTLAECTQYAYEVISKRTGKMVGGVFVKDGPQEELKPKRKVAAKQNTKNEEEGGK